MEEERKDGRSCSMKLNSEDEIDDYSSEDVSMIIQAYMACTLYESIVHGDVSFSLNFDKNVEFGIYDCGGGRSYKVLEFELESNGAILY